MGKGTEKESKLKTIHVDLPLKKPKIFYGYFIVAAAFIIFATLNGTSFSFGIFLKPLVEEFGWTRAATAGAYSVYMLVTGLFSVITGKLTDRFGPKLILTICGFFLSLGYLLTSRINAIWQLYLFWGTLSAIGMSGGIVPLTSVVSRWFVRRRGLMNGVAVSGIGAGNAIVSPIAAWLIANYGWRISYLVIGIAALLLVVSAAQLLILNPSLIHQLPDGDHMISQDDKPEDVEGHSFQKSIRTKQFWILSVMYFCFGFNTMVVLTHIVPHMTDVGISAAIAASVLAIVGAVSIAGRIGMGGASDWLGGCKFLFILGFALLSVTYISLLVVREPWMFYLVAVFMGVAYGGLVALRPQVVADLFGLKTHGAILGMVTFVHSIGSGVGAFVAGWIFDIAGSYFFAFLVCALLAAIGVILSSLLNRPH